MGTGRALERVIVKHPGRNQTRITLTNVKTNLLYIVLSMTEAKCHAVLVAIYKHMHWAKSFKDKPVQVGLASTSCPSAPA